MYTNDLNIDKGKSFNGLFEKAGNGQKIRCFLWVLFGLPVIFICSSFFVWPSSNFSTQAYSMGAMATTVYVGVSMYWAFSNSYQVQRTLGLTIIYTIVGFTFIIAILAWLKLLFSPVFLLISFILIVGWNITGNYLFRGQRQQYLILTGGMADELRDFKNRNWTFINELKQAKDKSNFDAIVADHKAYDPMRMLDDMVISNLRGLPILNAATLVEDYYGRITLGYVNQKELSKFAKIKKYGSFKRFWEVTLILIFFPVIAAIMAVAAILVKIDSDGPVLFKQKRVGSNGKEFTLYKFRTMRSCTEEKDAQFAKINDNRVTRWGTHLRKYRIDELPQFWNVIKGDMSLIGPRPEQTTFVETFNKEIPLYPYRHQIRPGITGWAQVRDGYAASLSSTKRKLEYDLYYLKNCSFSLDLFILFSTVKIILTGFGSR